jgi:hypothetical protein
MRRYPEIFHYLNFTLLFFPKSSTVKEKYKIVNEYDETQQLDWCCFTKASVPKGGCRKAGQK